MAIREALNKYGALVIIVAVALAGGAWYLFQARSNAIPSKEFYIDEETGEEVALDIKSAAPLIGKSGKPTLVRVVKFSCDNGKTVKVGYYSKFDEKTKEHLDAMNSGKIPYDSNYLSVYGMYIRAPAKGSPWVKYDSPEASQIKMTMQCPNGNIEMIFPP
jgi:hypothetical protein